MAGVGSDSTWLHLIGKPSQEDVDADNEAFAKNPNSHVPMTTRREIWAWYAFDIARGPFWIILLGLVLPVYLSTITTRSACINNAPYGCDYEDKPIMSSEDTLVVYIGGWSLKPEAWVTLSIAISGVLQVIGYLWMSSIADYSTYRNTSLRIATIAGSVLTISAVFIPDTAWLFFGLYAAFSFVLIGLSFIFYNSYLPILVQNHWLIRRLERECGNKTVSAEVPGSRESYEESQKHLVRSIQDDISLFAYGSEYIGTLFATILAGAALFMLEDVTTEIVDGYGTVNEDDANEYWMKPVVGMDVWWTTIQIMNLSSSEVISNASYLHGIQLRYEYDGEALNGSIYGFTASDNFALEYDTDSVMVQRNSFHSTYDVVDGGHIIAINLLEDRNLHIISGIQLITDSTTSSIGDTLSSDSIDIKPENYPNYELSGYQIATASHSEIGTLYNLSATILSGYSFAFMDIEKGQYGSTFDNRLVYSMCGVWSLLFSMPAFIFLKRRKSDKSLPETNGNLCSPICTVSFSDNWEALKSSKEYPNLFWCLFAWFIWSDAEGTTVTIGVLFGIELGLDGLGLLLIMLEVQILGFLGGIFWVWFQKRFQWTNKSLVMFLLAINSLLPLYAAIGFIPSSPFGLVSVWELYVFVGLCYAFPLAGLFGASRSLYGHLIPEGKESQFFGLYEFTNKGSSWIGPLLATFIANALSLRYTFGYIFVFFAVAVPILYFKVDYEQGMIDAGKVQAAESKNESDQKSAHSAVVPMEVTDGRTQHVVAISVSSVAGLSTSFEPHTSS